MAAPMVNLTTVELMAFLLAGQTVLQMERLMAES